MNEAKNTILTGGLILRTEVAEWDQIKKAILKFSNTKIVYQKLHPGLLKIVEVKAV